MSQARWVSPPLVVVSPLPEFTKKKREAKSECEEQGEEEKRHKKQKKKEWPAQSRAEMGQSKEPEPKRKEPRGHADEAKSRGANS